MITEKEFEDTYTKSFATLSRVLLRFGVTENSVEDYVQEAWARAWENRHAFRGDCKLLTWVIRIGLNKFYMDARKTENKVQHVSYTILIDDRIQSNTAPKALELEAVTKLLRGNVDNFDRYLEFIYQHNLEGFFHNAIAKKAGINYSTYKVKLFRIRRELDKVLARL